MNTFPHTPSWYTPFFASKMQLGFDLYFVSLFRFPLFHVVLFEDLKQFSMRHPQKEKNLGGGLFFHSAVKTV